ncbi:MAG: class I SAM-dependent methyltransferase [Candidatus Falkowbacteria bacterium]
MNTEILQSEHFDKLIGGYEKHYDDKYSRLYRESFINRYLFDGIELRGKNALEGMCGSGQTTRYLLDRGARVTCVDISGKALDRLRSRFPTVNVIKAAMKNTGMDNASYDCVAIVGGLHHTHPDLNRVLDEAHRILKTNGYLCFFEPHRGSLPDLVRKFWYKLDNYFVSNERSIDIESLKREYEKRFKFTSEHYSGNLAYIFVYNSWVIRSPEWLKALYSPVLLKLESFFRIFQNKKFSCYVICQWQKK